jgi:hypothetical protein
VLLGCALIAGDELAKVSEGAMPWKTDGNNGIDANDFLGTRNNASLIIRTNTGGSPANLSEVVRITPSSAVERGRVGIGTATPTQRLSLGSGNLQLPPAQAGLDGNLYLGGRTDLQETGMRLFGGLVNGQIPGGFIDVRTTDAAEGLRVRVDDGVGATERMRITAGGNVGIGTSQPRTQLHALGRIASGAEATSAGAMTFFPPDGFASFHIDNGPAGGRQLGRLRISHGTEPGEDEIVNILQNGNVGVGTATPAARVTAAGVGPQLGGALDAAAVLGRMSNFPPAPAGETAGVRGVNDDGHGVQGQSSNFVGVEGTSRSGTAVFGDSQSGVGVLGRTVSGLAGLFQGNVHVAGNLSKAGGGFTIDHPLDPADHYLHHSFVESAERKNIYDGIVTLDDDGEAEVALPRWFEALNRDPRYQLTAIGMPAPNLHVSREAADGRFAIAGGAPRQKVSWQLTGIRDDAWSRAHPLAVEEPKDEEDKGRFLHPELHDHGEEHGVMASLDPHRRAAARPVRQA